MMKTPEIWSETLKEMFLAKKNRRFILLIFGILVTGFLLTSLLGYYASRNSLRSEIETNTLPLTSDNIYSEIQHDILRPVFISSMMASDTFCRDWVIEGEKDPERMSKYLREIRLKYKTFTSFFVSDRTLNYYYSDGILKKISPEEERDVWYYRVRNMKEDYEINVDPDLANRDALTIFINYRVYAYDGSFIGATGVGLTIEAVKDMIEKYQEKYGRRIYFVDDKGDVRLSGSSFPKSLKNVSQIGGMSDSVQMLKTKKDNFFSFARDGELVHVNMRRIPEFQWYLIVEQGEEGTTRHIFRTLVINMAICSIVTLLIMMLMFGILKTYQKKLEMLRGIVPICAYCKKIRDDKGYWDQLETFVARHTDAEFSHGICPTCMKKNFPDYIPGKKEK